MSEQPALVNVYCHPGEGRLDLQPHYTALKKENARLLHWLNRCAYHVSDGRIRAELESFLETRRTR